MLRIVLRWAVNAIALWVAIQFVPGLNHEGSGLSLLLLALVFGLVNALVRPVLLFMTCPLIMLTLGLFILVVNTVMLSLTAWLSDILQLGLTIDGFWATFWGAVVISVVSAVINTLVKDDNEEEKKRG